MPVLGILGSTGLSGYEGIPASIAVDQCGRVSGGFYPLSFRTLRASSATVLCSCTASTYRVPVAASMLPCRMLSSLRRAWRRRMEQRFGAPAIERVHHQRCLAGPRCHSVQLHSRCRDNRWKRSRSSDHGHDPPETCQRPRGHLFLRAAHHSAPARALAGGEAQEGPVQPELAPETTSPHLTEQPIPASI